MDQLTNNTVVQIKHINTGTYLSGTKIPLCGGILGLLSSFRKAADKWHAGGSTQSFESECWELQRFQKYSQHIQIGDMFTILHKQTGKYLFNQLDQYYLSDTAIMYILQSIDGNTSDLNVHYRAIRIVSVEDLHILQCVDTDIRLSEFLSLKNILGTLSDDPNNHWEIIQQPNLNIVNIDPKQVNHQDLVIIRNHHTGYSLHSHTAKYPTTKQQEVTAKRFPRDDNDWWEITCDNPFAESITFNTAIYLRHQKTNSYITMDNKTITHSKCGLQTQCIPKQPNNAIVIQTIDGQPLIVGKPFYILLDNHYLVNVPKPSEVSTFQNEVCFSPSKCNAALWIVEQSCGI